MIKALEAAEGNELPGEVHCSDRGEEEEDCGKGRAGEEESREGNDKGCV